MQNRESGKLFLFKLTIVEMDEYKRKKNEQRLAEGGHTSNMGADHITEIFSDEDSDGKKPGQGINSAQEGAISDFDETDYMSGTRSEKEEKKRKQALH